MNHAEAEQRHPNPRADCIEVGWDYPHEAKGWNILAGEWDCPACRPRASEKLRLIIQQDMLEEQRRANDLRERELSLREQGDWAGRNPEPRPAYVSPPRIMPPSVHRRGL